VAITAAFRTVYVLVVMEIGSRQILHQNVTAHPTAEWMLQQLREALPGDHPYRFAIHDRDSIFSEEVDKGFAKLSVRVLRTPVRALKPNSVCERLGGSLRRECLDFLIPFNERHLQMTVRAWTRYNRGHSALGPGLPEPMSDQVPPNEHRHRLPVGYRVVKRSGLGGLHHEYGLVRAAA
jgi:transposase InsO family protein